MRILVSSGIVLTLGVPFTIAQNRQQLEDAAKPLIATLDVKIGGSDDYGAGIIVGVGSDRLYIATANHVVRKDGKDADAIQVGFHWLPGDTRPGRVLTTYDEQLDLAVVVVEQARALAVPALPFDRFEAAALLKKGDLVFPMGYPNRQARLTRALPDAISSVQDRVRFDSNFVVPGHSGGALLTDTFRVAGLVTERLPGQGGAAIPIERVIQALKAWNYPVQWKLATTTTTTAAAAAGTPPNPAGKARKYEVRLVGYRFVRAGAKEYDLTATVNGKTVVLARSFKARDGQRATMGTSGRGFGPYLTPGPVEVESEDGKLQLDFTARQVGGGGKEQRVRQVISEDNQIEVPLAFPNRADGDLFFYFAVLPK